MEYKEVEKPKTKLNDVKKKDIEEKTMNEEYIK